MTRIILEIGRERPLVIVHENHFLDRFKDRGILFQGRRYVAVVTKKLDRPVEEFLEFFSGYEMIQSSGFIGRCQDDQISKLPGRTKLAETLFRHVWSSPKRLTHVRCQRCWLQSNVDDR